MNHSRELKKVVVTGGAGFIGSNLVRNLALKGVQVLNLDALTYAGRRESLLDIEGRNNYSFQQLDITDATKVRSAFNQFRPDAVLHLAAESHVDRSIDGPMDFVRTNVTGTVVLLEAALEYWQGLDTGARENFCFLHVSTDEVYGSLGIDGAFTEESKYLPNSPYSASKAAADNFARAWFKTYGLPVIISNCSNNYGPYQFPEKLIPVVILSALEDRPIPVYGKGENVRDWLYVEDHVNALIGIAARGRTGDVYLVGGGAEVSNIELVKLICGLMDELAPNPNRASHSELISFVEDRPGHDFRYAIDCSKLTNELGWQPSESFQSGLRRTVMWYLENRNWWEPIRAKARKRLGRQRNSSNEIGR